MAARNAISVDILRQLLRLDPDSGRLYWRERSREMFATRRAFSTWNARYAGKEAFTAANRNGYRFGAIFNRNYLAHRVIFAIAYGRWPAIDVDHRDGDPANNKLSNLREATPKENARNVSGQSGSTSAFKGVSWAPQCGKWCARGRDALGHSHYLGVFASEIDAARACDAFTRREHGEFVRLNLDSVDDSP